MLCKWPLLFGEWYKLYTGSRRQLTVFNTNTIITTPTITPSPPPPSPHHHPHHHPITTPIITPTPSPSPPPPTPSPTTDYSLTTHPHLSGALLTEVRACSLNQSSLRAWKSTSWSSFVSLPWRCMRVFTKEVVSRLSSSGHTWICYSQWRMCSLKPGISKLED